MRKDKKIKAICEELKAEGLILDFSYDHFRQSDAVPPPFAVYRRVAPANFSADGVVYHRGDNVDLELYASTPEEMAELMIRVEEKLDKAEIFYKVGADTVYIQEPEDFYESLYEI